MKRCILACFLALLILSAGCSAPSGGKAVSSDISSVPEVVPSESSSCVSSETSSVATSSAQSVVSQAASSHRAASSLVTTISSSKSISVPTLETKDLLFAEDDQTKAIFHIGMTTDQVKQALTKNQMKTGQNEYPNTCRISTNHGVDLLFTLGTDFFDMISIGSDSGTQLHSPYGTQKGLKIGDTVETVRKLYGNPVKQMKYGDEINGLGLAYFYNIAINLDDYYKEQTGKHKSDRGVYLRINISQSKGNNFNKVDSIIYAEKANN